MSEEEKTRTPDCPCDDGDHHKKNKCDHVDYDPCDKPHDKPYDGKKKHDCDCPDWKTTELVKNGGFEKNTGADTGGPSTFAHWTIDVNLNKAEIFPGTTDGNPPGTHPVPVYEGEFAAVFETEPGPGRKTGRIYQEVKVTPCCLLKLSFAEVLFYKAKDFTSGSLTARVFATDSDHPLINVAIINRGNFPTAGDSYNYHEKLAFCPVPCNVHTVTVEFEFDVTDDPASGESDETLWLLDGVSLRAVFCDNDSK